MKKITLTILVCAVLVIFINVLRSNVFNGEEQSLVKWHTFSEAVELAKKTPKPIMVDVYTQWCGPCKMMSAYTFNHPQVASYLNEHFYPVKFDAETFDTVAFNNVSFVNKNAPGTNRAVHDFAISILDGKLLYPSIVFLSENINRIQTVTGYHQAAQFEPIMKYFGSSAYKSMKYEEFQKTFVPEIK
jgi:thioredoxin-related protein